MRRKFHVVGSDPGKVFDDLTALREDSTGPHRRRGRLRETFACIPHGRALELYRHIQGPAWALLIELDRLIFQSRGKNPIKLTNHSLNSVGLTGHTRTRALRQLEAAGVISVQRHGRGRNPIVRHHWFPVQD